MTEMRRTILAVLLAPLATIGLHTTAHTPWDLPPGVPPPVVTDPATLAPERVALGRYLFYEQRLSANGTQSCGTCHRREFAFTDTRPRAIGSTGQVHPRSSMSLVNVAYRDTLTWSDPKLTSLEQQALVPMFGEDPIELGLKGHEVQLYARLADDPMYVRLFGDAFPGDPSPISTDHIVSALAAFQRTIVSFRSAYDRYHFQGDNNALSPAARRGEALFASRRVGCAQCHSGLNFDAGSRTSPPTDLFVRYASSAARSAHQPNPEEAHGFRTPTLRNIARTAPYMHDGRVPTLADVLGQYGVALAADERADLLAFLDSLTDIDALVDSRWADPWRTKYE